MSQYENPQVELLEVVGSWGFDPAFREPQEALPMGNDICILPDSKEVCPIIGTRPLTVVNGSGRDYVVGDERRVLGRIATLSDTQRLFYSKYGPWSLISGAEIFPPGYLEEDVNGH